VKAEGARSVCERETASEGRRQRSCVCVCVCVCACVCGVFVQAKSDWSERSVYKLCCFFGMQATRPGGIGLRAACVGYLPACLPFCARMCVCACFVHRGPNTRLPVFQARNFKIEFRGWALFCITRPANHRPQKRALMPGTHEPPRDQMNSFPWSSPLSSQFYLK